RVRVADFGLARRHDDDRAEPTAFAAGSEGSAIAGTPGYMAPEQHEGVAGPAADQFAFAVALTEALAQAASPRRGRVLAASLALVAVGGATAAALAMRGGGADSPWRPTIVELQPQIDENSDAPSISPDGRLI